MTSPDWYDRLPLEGLVDGLTPRQMVARLYAAESEANRAETKRLAAQAGGDSEREHRAEGWQLTARGLSRWWRDVLRGRRQRGQEGASPVIQLAPTNRCSRSRNWLLAST